MRVGGKCHTSASLSPRKNRHPMHKRLGGRQGRSEQVRKTLPIPAFDTRTIRFVSSRYADYSIPAHSVHRENQLNYLKIK
jgi:hypothetical protein